MSEKKHVLIFTFHGKRFAVDALAVKEIAWLPELTPMEEVPAYIAGVFNLRGKIVPVMDLNIRFGHEQERYSVADRVIIIEKPGATTPAPPYQGGEQREVAVDFGIIVSDVHDVVSITESDMEPVIKSSVHFIIGEMKVGEEIVMLLDHYKICETGLVNREAQIRDTNHEIRDTLPSFSPEEQSIFHSRSLALMQTPESLTLDGLTPLAVVGLNSEYYGVDLETVREFSNIGSVTPVPCTPPHIVGDMNLRGDILTLVDIRGMLDIPLKGGSKEEKVIVTHINELLAGVTVDEVFEVIYLSPSDIRPVPSAVKASNEYISGEAPYGGKMLSILDLKKILTREELVVEENK